MINGEAQNADRDESARDIAELKDEISAAIDSPSALRSLERRCLEAAMKARQQDRSEHAISVLAPFAEAGFGSASLHFQLALAYREMQDLDAARHAIERAAQLAPDDPDINFAYAQFSFENWRPAARLFRDAQRLAPNNLTITKNAAAALVAEGKTDAATRLLERALSSKPDWTDGHQQLAKYRILQGDREHLDRSFEIACKAHPTHLPLRLAWFHLLAQARDWDRAVTVIDEGEKRLGETRAFNIARAFIACERGDNPKAETLLQKVHGVDDPGLDLCRVRFYLRLGEARRAQDAAEKYIGASAMRSFWPYLSIAWRLLGDERAYWLDREDAFIRTFDLDLSQEALQELAAALRSLHTAKAPYLEQSVRGGTQTDRNLFFNSNPAIQSLRAGAIAAAETYIHSLPPQDDHHPLLKPDRSRIRFNGAWSVLLKPNGFNISHTHTDGWISSAFYVDIPGGADLGESPSGWISFGEAPPALDIDLKPYKQVKPAPGTLVLFPSTMWHRTIPFGAGERLTIAFDIGERGR